VIARTATYAYSNVVFQYLEEIVQTGIQEAIKNNHEIACAINTHQGEIINLDRLTTRTI
jgi:alanine dehydrogenase